MKRLVIQNVLFFLVGVTLGFLNGRVYQIRADTNYFFHLSDPHYELVTPTPSPTPDVL